MAINMKSRQQELFSFDDYEKKLNDDREKQFVALEFYKNMVEQFKWDNNYYVREGWRHNYPTLVVNGLTSSQVEFMFGGDSIIVHVRRIPFVIPINDQYIEAIKKIIAIFDYVEGDEEKTESGI